MNDFVSLGQNRRAVKDFILEGSQITTLQWAKKFPSRLKIWKIILLGPNPFFSLF